MALLNLFFFSFGNCQQKLSHTLGTKTFCDTSGTKTLVSNKNYFLNE